MPSPEEQWGRCWKPVLQDSHCVLAHDHGGPCEDVAGNRVLFDNDFCYHPVGSTYCTLEKGHGGAHTSERAAREGVPLGARRQQEPKQSHAPGVTGLVVKDLLARKELGVEKYGTELKPFNSRDALLDAYQEMLDMVEYMRQRLYEDYGE